jgi:hypothetical protein
LANGYSYIAATAVAYVQGNDATPQTPQTAVNVTFTSAQTVGDLNVVVIGWNDTTALVKTITDSRGNTYTLAVGPTIVSGSLYQSIYYAKNIAAAAAGANAVTVTFSVAVQYPDIRILEYSGADLNIPVDVTAAGSGNSASSSSPAVTTTNPTDLIFGANIVATTTQGPGSGFTERLLTTPDGDSAEDMMVTAKGSYSTTAPLTSSGLWIMQMVAFRTPSGSSAPVSVTLTPASVTLTPSQTQAFTATVANTSNTAVTWSLSPAVGSISAAGLYTAPASITAAQTVTITATSVANPAVTASATVSLTPAVKVTLTPVSVTLTSSQTQTFTATVANTSNTTVTWSLSPAVGSISAAGLYTAPASITAAQTVTVTATSVANPAVSASATVSLTAAVRVTLTPVSVTLTSSQTQAFAATVANSSNTAVTWLLSPAVGSISAAGLYTAPALITAAQTVTITATSVANPAVSASATVSLALLTPTLSINATSIPFGSVVVNTISTQLVTLTSTGTAPVTISAATLAGTGYTMSGVTFPVTLNPTQAVTLSVLFDPTITGLASGQLTITSNSSTNSTVVIPLSGTGVAASYEVNLSWDAPSSSVDPVAGYNIYRSPDGSSTYQLLNSTIGNSTTYLDTTVQAGLTYDYIVESVDASSVDSTPSNMIVVTIP